MSNKAVIENQKKPIYKKWWFWVIAVFFVIGVGGNLGGGGGSTPPNDAGIENAASQNVAPPAKSGAETVIAEEQDADEPKEAAAPTEHLNALAQAQIYSDTMNMSKKGLYAQLTSEFGGQFEKEAAQYAIDNVTADWKENAVKQARSYSETMNMSKKAVYDQLKSEYGGQFTKEEAQYAIDNY